MKRLIIFAMALLYVGIATAQINTIIVNTKGDVKLRQGNVFDVVSERDGSYETMDSVLYLNGWATSPSRSRN